jgi:sulfur carrier protein
VNVVVNGRSRNVAEDSTVEDVVREVRGEGVHSGVAVARNGEILPRAAGKDPRVADGDRIEVLAAVQGG